MTCASVNRSRLPDDLRRKTISHSVSKSRAFSKLDLSRLPPLARARTLPNSRVHKVAMRLLSLQSVVRKTSASAFSAAMFSPFETSFSPPAHHTDPRKSGEDGQGGDPCALNIV